MIEIRLATPEDATDLAELRWEFRSPRGANTESHDAFVARCGDWMRAHIGAGDWRAWLAADDRRIVGQLWMQLIGKIPNPAIERERHAYISNVYVTPGSRGGVGGRLLTAALETARADQVDSIVLWPTAESRTLYARHGFVSSDNVMELKLPNAAPRS